MRYPGSELELFAAAANWKTYSARMLSPFVAGDVLEVGGGIGANIPYLANPGARSWTSLEPDPALAHQAAERVANSGVCVPCTVIPGTIEQIPEGLRFDTILYVDVLEHIADDRAELARAAALLASGGKLVVLAPAHAFLFSAFDRAIGHFRRYNRGSLAALTPPGCRLRAVWMLDSAGFFVSLANALLLRAAQPSPGQIRVWDRFLVPLSARFDPCLGYRFGKSIAAVWCR